METGYYIRLEVSVFIIYIYILIYVFYRVCYVSLRDKRYFVYFLLIWKAGTNWLIAVEKRSQVGWFLSLRAGFPRGDNECPLLWVNCTVLKRYVIQQYMTRGGAGVLAVYLTWSPTCFLVWQFARSVFFGSKDLSCVLWGLKRYAHFCGSIFKRIFF